MEIQDFIEKAIEGGWQEGYEWKFVRANQYWVEWLNGNGDPVVIALESYLLNPKIWQAVGKVEGWDEGRFDDPTYACGPENRWMWEHHMYRMIDAICEGKTIEEFIKTL